MKIGILQTGHSPDTLMPRYGDYGQFFEKLLTGHGFDFQTYSVVDMELPASITDQDGWLITGSKHGAYEDLPFIPPLEDMIRDIYAAAIPLVGICFGHQIIAQALGGKVAKFDGGWAVGRQTYDWNGETIALNAWHQDQVTHRPADAQVCATNAFCENAALVYGNRAFTVQAHPEFNSAFTAELADIRGEGVVPKPLLENMRANLDKPIDDTRIALQIARFFKERNVA